MKKYNIPFTFQKYGEFIVEANNIQEAKEKAEKKLDLMSEEDLEISSNYINDSSSIDYNLIVEEDI